MIQRGRQSGYRGGLNHLSSRSAKHGVAGLEEGADRKKVCRVMAVIYVARRDEAVLARTSM